MNRFVDQAGKGALLEANSLSLPKLPSPGELQQSLAKSVFDSLAALKQQVGEVVSVLKNPVKFNGATIDYSGLSDSSMMHGRGTYYWSVLTFSSRWEVASIPLSVGYQNQYWTDVRESGPFIASVKFDRGDYLKQLQSRLRSKMNLENFGRNLSDPLLLIKQQAEQGLRTELEQLNQKYDQLLRGKISELGDLQSLLTGDLLTVRGQLMNLDYAEHLSSLQERYTELQNKANLGQVVDPEELTAIKDALRQHKGLEEMLQKVEAHKAKWTSSGLLAKIKEWDLLKQQQLRAFISDPATITKLARQNLSLSSVQRLFLKINQFRGGQNTVTTSPLSMNHFLNNGLLSEFIEGGKTLMLFWGRQPRTASLNDLPFENTGLLASGKAGRFARQNSRGASSSISIMSFNQGFADLISSHTDALLRRSIVTTLSKEFLLGAHGKLTTEVSRSVTSYNPGGSQGEKNGLEELLSTSNLLQNTAFTVLYADEYPGADLSYQVQAGKVAGGYSNPGSVFLNQGSQQLGIKVRKSLVQKRLQLSLHTDVKEYQYREAGQQKWRNTYTVFDVRWRLKKGQSLSLRYLPSRMVRIEAAGKHLASSFDRLSLDANLSARPAGLPYFQFGSLSYQRNQYGVGSGVPYGGESLMLISNHSLLVGRTLFFANAQYSQNLGTAGLVYFNTSFTTDLGASYAVLRGLSASSALAFASAHQWYRQIGVRQTLSGALSDRCTLNFFVDARKSLKVYQPLLFGPLRLEASFHYSFKNK